MGHVRLSEHIDAPSDHVWDINASCERLPEWNVNVVEVKDCQGRLDRVGARVTTVVRVFGTSAAGQLPILPDLYLEAERHGVEVVAPPTPEACRLLEAADPADVAAILHVTC